MTEVVDAYLNEHVDEVGEVDNEDKGGYPGDAGNVGYGDHAQHVE